MCRPGTLLMSFIRCAFHDAPTLVDRQFTRQLDSRCDKTAWLPTLYYTLIVLFAQLAITLRLVTASDRPTPTAYDAPRVYAVTGKNRWIAACLYYHRILHETLWRSYPCWWYAEPSGQDPSRRYHVLPDSLHWPPSFSFL